MLSPGDGSTRITTVEILKEGLYKIELTALMSLTAADHRLEVFKRQGTFPCNPSNVILALHTKAATVTSWIPSKYTKLYHYYAFFKKASTNTTRTTNAEGVFNLGVGVQLLLIASTSDNSASEVIFVFFFYRYLVLFIFEVIGDSRILKTGLIVTRINY